MKKRSLLLVIGVLVVILVVTVLALPERPLQAGSLTVGYVGSGRFWLSNTTTKTLVAQLWYVETMDGTNWIEWGAPNHRVELEPHSGAFDLVFAASQPTPTNTWRLRGTVGEKLVGFAEVRTAIRYYPTAILYRHRTGDTNVSIHPLPKGATWYGKHRELVSAAVSEY